jgi:hypothetical protein
MADTLPVFDKLGSFYLGKSFDLTSKQRDERAYTIYDSKDLVTHAVCVGMTGSGKTGLCLGLIEEAALDGIPAIVIDPKGDLSNLLLTFPGLTAADFRPWINEEDARKKGLEPDAFAAQQAELWKKGLANWEQDGARVQRLRDAADFTIYTPGSNAGQPVSIVKSFAPPPIEILEDSELFRERISSTATSLLGLANITGDPVTSREHILVCTLLGEAWAKGLTLDIPAIIGQIQSPPISRIGVMELESFYPAKERFTLAMALNSIVASPGFSRWTEGEPLDISNVLYTKTGKPRVAIFSIAHLNDAERMFFVSLLMNQILGWVRTQSGTSSLRAMVYMDEIAGYFPPVANPPSKQPMLTLMKQGRAFGLGMVLATQNPVDIDYKGLSNAGTWFIGRLQTERDKARVLDGLEGAAAGSTFDRAKCDAMLSQLGSRVFLMNNVHDDGPTVFETRWCLSYLRGPLTRNQIKQLMDAKKSTQTVSAGIKAPNFTPPSFATPASAEPAPAPVSAAPPTSSPVSGRPVLPPDVPQYFIPSRATGPISYRPMLMGTARVYYTDSKQGIDTEQPATLLVPIADGPVVVDWDHAESSDLTDREVEREPARRDASYAPLPAAAAKAKSYTDWQKGLVDCLFRDHSLELFTCKKLKMSSKPGESERDFGLRANQAARELRDAAVDKLRDKFAPKLALLAERIRKHEQTVEVQKQQAKSAKVDTALSFGSALLSAFMGKKLASAGNVGKAATAAKGIGRSAREASDVDRAEENLSAVQEQFKVLEEECEADVAEVTAEYEQMAAEIEPITLKPKKTNITVRSTMLVWAPFAANGEKAF